MCALKCMVIADIMRKSACLRNTTTNNITGRFCKGVYAISVSGRLPAGVIREMKSRGIVYRPRDTSQR